FLSQPIGHQPIVGSTCVAYQVDIGTVSRGSVSHIQHLIFHIRKLEVDTVGKVFYPVLPIQVDFPAFVFYGTGIYITFGDPQDRWLRYPKDNVIGLLVEPVPNYGESSFKEVKVNP